jgi:hypothetical protein
VTFHVYTNVTDFIVAESLDECWQLFEKHTGERRVDYEEGDPFGRLVDEMPIKILCENGRPSDSGEFATKTAAEWVAQEGKGFLCSTEY